MSINFVNLTPHSVTVAGTTFPSEGFARRDETVGDQRHLGDMPVLEVRQGDVIGLPGPLDGVYYIVSRVTAEAAAGRDDVLFPHGEIRDGTGRIVGVRRLARFVR